VPELPSSLSAGRDRIVAEVRRLAASGVSPVVIALDGGSGAGKSTLARPLADALGAALVPTDDFYAAHVTDAEWASSTAAARADRCVDWRRLRVEALEPLLAGRPARWRPLDFEAGARPDGTYALSRSYRRCAPGGAIVLDGAYSSRPELADLLHLSVLVDVPSEVRYRRLAAREEEAFLQHWHERWDEAEHHYFTNVRPRALFDLVVSNMDRNRRFDSGTVAV